MGVVRRAGNPVTSLVTLAEWPDQATVRMEQWLVASMAIGQWAYLEHDARLVAEWLVEDLSWTVPAEDTDPDCSESNS